ncbi:MAG: hypothetical protein KDK51_05255 [Deltaproteobacteria bacterium]|nr:hypothetical protein [Deltaproteobacteria bacterium]
MIRQSNKGFTYIELFLYLLIALIFSASFYSSYQIKKTKVSEQNCQESRWRWIGFTSKFERLIRKWVLEAPLCFNEAFLPFEFDEENSKYVLFTINTVEPLLKDMTASNLIRIPIENEFSNNSMLLICNGAREEWTKVLDINKKTDGNVTIIRLENDIEESRMFQNDAYVIDYVDTTFQLVKNTRSNGINVVEEVTYKTPKNVLSDLDDFSLDVSWDEQNQEILYNIKFVRDACEYDYNNSVKVDINNLGYGNWYLQEKRLIFRPFITETIVKGNS